RLGPATAAPVRRSKSGTHIIPTSEWLRMRDGSHGAPVLPEELDRVQALYDDNFGVVPEGLPDTDKVNGGVGS
ncbi:MAG: hypothetical protein ABGZ36_14250, partial [Actinomycetota bacterium]